MKKVISISLSKTINLGNYESAKIEVGLEQDVESADVQVGFGLVHDEVSQFLNGKELEIRKEYGLRKGRNC